MPRLLLIFVLVAAQLFSWSASPLFLCCDDDGELSIDLGPGACQCDRHSHPLADQAAPIQGERIAASTTCDCVHVPLTVAFTAVTVNSKETRAIAVSNPPALLTNSAGRICLTPLCQVSPNHRPVAHQESCARTAILRC
jgi:hypothetical protein